MSDCDWLSAFRAKLTVAIAVVPLPVAGASSCGAERESFKGKADKLLRLAQSCE